MLVSLVAGECKIDRCEKCFEKDETICEKCAAGLIGHYCIASEPPKRDVIIFSVFGTFLMLGVAFWFLLSLVCLSLDPNIWILIHAIQLTKIVTLLDAQYSPTYKFFYDSILAPFNLTFMLDLDHETENERFKSYGFDSD